jgi:hypothetical protein
MAPGRVHDAPAQEVSGWAAWLAVARKTSSISLTVAVGRACSTRAATPA